MNKAIIDNLPYFYLIIDSTSSLYINLWNHILYFRIDSILVFAFKTLLVNPNLKIH